VLHARLAHVAERHRRTRWVLEFFAPGGQLVFLRGPRRPALRGSVPLLSAVQLFSASLLWQYSPVFKLLRRRISNASPLQDARQPSGSIALAKRAVLWIDGFFRHLEPCYKQHAAVDDKAGVILDVQVTTGEKKEGEMLTPQVDEVKATKGVNIKNKTSWLATTIPLCSGLDGAVTDGPTRSTAVSAALLAVGRFPARSCARYPARPREHAHSSLSDRRRHQFEAAGGALFALTARLVGSSSNPGLYIAAQRPPAVPRARTCNRIERTRGPTASTTPEC